MTERKQADFALIRQRVTLQMLLDHYQILDLKREGKELRGTCPICGTGKRPFAVNPSKNIFQCFTCEAKGNVIDFVAKKESCSLREAGLKIWKWFSLDEETSSPTAPTPPEPRGELQASEPAAPDVQQEILGTLKEILAELRQLRQEAE
jgi:DNA primase